MKVYVQKNQEKIEMPFSDTVEKLLKKLDINPETVIVTKNGTLVTETDILEDSDDVEILQVISGG